MASQLSLQKRRGGRTRAANALFESINREEAYPPEVHVVTAFSVNREAEAELACGGRKGRRVGRLLGRNEGVVVACGANLS